MDKERVDTIVNAYIESFDDLDHEQPDIPRVKEVLEKEIVKKISGVSRAEIGNYTKEGLHKKLISKHKWPNKSIPFGYKLSKDQEINIKKTERRMVKFIFDTYLKENSINTVAYRFQKKFKADMDKSRVHYILRNPIYMGVYQVSDEVAYIDELEIIKPEDFLKVQELFKDARHRTKPMDPDVKRSKVDKIFDEYFHSLDEDDDEVIKKKIPERKIKTPVNKKKRAETLEFESDYLLRNIEEMPVKDQFIEMAHIGEENIKDIIGNIQRMKKDIKETLRQPERYGLKETLQEVKKDLQRTLADMQIIQTNFSVIKEFANDMATHREKITPMQKKD